MPFTDVSWESPETQLEAADYCAVCLIDENPAGEPKVTGLCKLPVRATPGGPVNRTALHAAAAALAGARGGVKASAESKGKAARRLIRLYREAGEQPPESLRRMG